MLPLSSHPTDSSLNSLRFTPGVRVLLFFLIAFIALIVPSVFLATIGFFLKGFSPTVMLRLAAVVQDLFVFILPPVITALIVSASPARLLAVDRGIYQRLFLLACVTYICGCPALECIVRLNNGISLPEALSSVEEWMRMMEDAAARQVEVLLGSDSVASLVVSVLIVGVMAGLSEELFFRGGLQRLLMATRLNHHAAIWITAFVFSSFHFQFFGFFPRMLLGADFVYLLYWSGSLWLPIAIHILNNCIVVVARWAGSVSDTPLTDSTDGSVYNLALIAGSVVLSGAMLLLMSRRGALLRKC